jgi:thiol-disulfide isomerase/thioredoxin
MKNKLELLVSLLSLIIPSVISAQEPNVKSEFMITGYCMVADIKNNPNTTEWYVPEYASYEPDKKVIDQLKIKNGLDYTLTVVLGTWCGDSKAQIPRLIKILDESGFNYDNLNMICVDRKKQATGIDLTSYNIVKVPTIIVFIDEEELGRIIETPAENLENDLLNILNNSKK